MLMESCLGAVLASVGFDAHNPGGMLSPAVAALWTRILTYAIVNVVGGPLSQSGQQSFHQFLAAREFAAPRLSDSVSDMETAWLVAPFVSIVMLSSTVLSQVRQAGSSVLVRGRARIQRCSSKRPRLR